MSIRLCLALAGFAAAIGCAAAPQVRREPATPAGADALYDPSAEWAEANRLPELPRRARMPRRRSAATELAFELSPAGEQRRLTARMLARSRPVQPIVRSASRTHAVAPDLVNGIIWVESRFHVNARSNKGACGLMQLMPRTGRQVARAIGLPYHPYDPQFNIHAGTYYFSRLVDRFAGNLTLALAAYNTGPGRVDGWLRDQRALPGYSRVYVDNVFGAARAFRLREY